MLKLLMLSGNDTAVIAQANSVHWAVNGFLQLFGTPLAGALSDSIGRKPLWALGRCTKLIWFMGSMFATNMNGYVAACILAWGVGDVGTLSVQEAAWADVFGDRPELSARLKASNQIWTGIAGLIGPVIGAQISLRSPTLGFYVSSAMCIIESVMVMCSQESLAKDERKPFAGIVPLLKKANPFSSIGLLFTNGPGLRSLGISAGFLRAVRDCTTAPACLPACLHACLTDCLPACEATCARLCPCVCLSNPLRACVRACVQVVTVYSTIEPFRLGPLGWSPQGAESACFCAICTGNHHFTKTGSGQT